MGVDRLSRKAAADLDSIYGYTIERSRRRRYSPAGSTPTRAALPPERVAHPQLRLPAAPQVVAGEAVAGEPGPGRGVEAVDVAAAVGFDAGPHGLEVPGGRRTPRGGCWRRAR